MTDITIPNVGESVSEVTIAQWFKQVGDTIKKDEALVELETDKAAQELVAPEDGVVEEILVSEGDNVAVGTLIAKLGAGNGAAAAPKEAAPAAAPAAKAAPKKAAPASGGTSMNIDVPNVGESVSEVTVASWMKQPGDAVKKDEAIVELETDKAAQELVAPESGVMGDILVAEGEVALVGQTICTLLAGASGGASTAPAAAAPKTSAPVASGKAPMPSADRIIKENNLDASTISGTGKDGRITKGDALAAKANPAPAAKAPVPIVPSAPRELGPREERVRMSRLRQTIARRLKEAQNTAAMLTTYNEVDMTNIMDMQKTWSQTWLYELLRQSLCSSAQRCSCGQCRNRRHGYHL